jgi:hypothetical protein
LPDAPSDAERSQRRSQLERWIRELCRFERPSASDGERRAAEWLAGEFEALGARASVERERAHGTHLPLALPNLAAGAAALLPGRWARTGLALAAAVTIVGELEGATRWLRRLLPGRATYNCVAELGDRDAPRTLVLVAHHDVARAWGPRFGALASAPPPPFSGGRPLPFVASLAFGPLLVSMGALLGRRRAERVGLGFCATSVALFTDIRHRRPVPGANDNGSGVAAILGVAHDLRADDVTGVRAILLSTGSEETMMEGMQGFLRTHRDRLDPSRTLVVCLDAVGWDRLVVRRSEGVLRSYRTDPRVLDEMVDAARAAGVDLAPAAPFAVPTDGLAARWAGLPTVFVGSHAADGGYPNYHRPADAPENVNLDAVDGARRLCTELIRRAVAPAADAADATVESLYS